VIAPAGSGVPAREAANLREALALALGGTAVERGAGRGPRVSRGPAAPAHAGAL